MNQTFRQLLQVEQWGGATTQSGVMLLLHKLTPLWPVHDPESALCLCLSLFRSRHVSLNRWWFPFSRFLPARRQNCSCERSRGTDTDQPSSVFYSDCVCVCSSCREQMLNPAVTAVLQCRKLTAGLQFSVHMIFFFLCYFYFELLVFMFSWVKLNQYQVSISSHSEFVFQNNCTLKLYRISSNSYFEIQTQTELIWSQKLFLCFLCDVFIYIVKRLQWTGFTQALYNIWKIVFQVSS